MGDGGYAVSWQTERTRTQSSDEDVRVQIFDSGGVKSPSAVRSPLTLYGGDGNDVLVGGSVDDVLFGGADNDVLDGFLGDDILFGGYGDDGLFGDSGNDTLDGGAGNDIIYGGEGVEVFFGGEGYDPDIDTVTFSGATTGIHVDIGGGERNDADGQGGYDTIDGVERVIGTEFSDYIRSDRDDSTLFGNGGADTLNGNYGDDFLDGGLGDDTLEGAQGDDLLLGGGGNDILDGDYGSDVLDGGEDDDILFGGANDDTLFGGDGNDTLNGDTSSSFSEGEGNDILFGGAGNDTLDGGDGKNVLSGGLGDDFLLGGDGEAFNHTVTFETSATLVSVDLDGGTASGEGSDVIFNVDNVIGSGFNDIIVGNDANNELNGGEGDDLISGLDGQDVFFGEPGNDTLEGGDGTDTLDFSAATSGVVVDLQNGSALDDFDSIDRVNDIEVVIGGDSGDVLIGGGFDPGQAANALDGGGGDDTLTGSGGDDTLFGADGGDILSGGTGNDTLEGGRGNDTLSGGDGNDEFIVGASRSSVTTIIGESESNDSLATANQIARSEFTIATNENVEDDDIPHVAIDGFIGGTNGADDVDFCRFDLFTGETLTLDIDFAENFGDPFDSVLQLFDSSNELVASDDDSSTNQGGGGSFDSHDSFLSFTVEEGGAFFATVSSFPNFFSDPTQPGIENSGNETSDYVLQVSINGLDVADGNDTINGGDGADRVDFSAFDNNGATLDLNITGAQFVNAQIGTDTFIDIENIRGTSNDDHLTGDGNDNTLDGGAGNDTLIGGGGNDILLGGGENDVLIGGAGQDSLDGGDLSDIFKFLAPSDVGSAVDEAPFIASGDFIDGLESGSDQIHLDGTAFGFSITGALTLNTNFFVVANFDGTSTSVGNPSDAFVVFDPASDTLFADVEPDDGGYTVVATMNGTPSASDIEIIGGLA